MRKRELTKAELQERENRRLAKLKLAKYCPKKVGCCWAYNPKPKKDKAIEG